MKSILCILFICFAGASMGQSKIDAKQLAELKKSSQLIDLRTDAELEKTGKIEGAVQINFASSDFSTLLDKLDKEKPIIVYCAAGGRSGKAAAMLSQKGFKTIYDYKGGMNDWIANGNKTVK